MEALQLTARTGSLPNAMEGLGVLATMCAQQGLDAEAFCLAGHVLQHPASKQDTRQLAEELQARILASGGSARQKAAQQIGRPVSLEVVMQQRFGFRLPATFS